MDLNKGILIEDSVTRLGDGHRGRVLIAGSHGGVYAAYLAACAGVRGVVLNDAGVGLDGAGIAGLDYLQALGIPAATVSTHTARIGDGADTAARGIVSHANSQALALGCHTGQPALSCAEAMSRAAPGPAARPPAIDEGRYRIGSVAGGVEVWALDSASLVLPEDAGRVLVIGSHGGAPGGRAETALKTDALAAVFHDAGVGVDRAGLGRLPFLDRRGIPAATVSAASARIGDGRSLWRTGVLSHVNETAAALGARPGTTVTRFVDAVASARVATGPRARNEEETS